jgi:hypothetical protein
MAVRNPPARSFAVDPVVERRPSWLPRVGDAEHVDPGLFNSYKVDLKTAIVTTRRRSSIRQAEPSAASRDHPHNLDGYVSRDGAGQIVFSRDVTGRGRG